MLEYKIISVIVGQGHDTNELEDKVNYEISQGWQPIGGTTYVPLPQGLRGIYIGNLQQAMVRKS